MNDLCASSATTAAPPPEHPQQEEPSETRTPRVLDDLRDSQIDELLARVTDMVKANGPLAGCNHRLHDLLTRVERALSAKEK